MPSKATNHNQESETTLRRKVEDLHQKQKWSTKAKVYLGLGVSALPLAAAIFTASQWINQNVAWAEDLKKSYVLQTIEVNQLRTEDRMWKIKHDLKDIEARRQMGAELPTDALEKQQLLDEYRFLLEQKQRWDQAEKEAAQ